MVFYTTCIVGCHLNRLVQTTYSLPTISYMILFLWSVVLSDVFYGFSIVLVSDLFAQWVASVI